MKKIALPFVLCLIVISSGCHRSRSVTGGPVAGGSEMLYQYRWNLTELNGQPVATDEKNIAHLLFYPGQVNKVSGSTGCNRLSGTYELSANSKIKFSPLVTTKMACAGIDEAPYLKALSEAENWSIVNKKLTLFKGTTAVAGFEGVSADKAK